MTEIKRNTRKIDRYTVETFSKEIVSACLLKVEAGTNGYQGGDSGHGSRTYISFEDQGGTDIRVQVEGLHNDADKITLVFGGDCELSSIIKALKFVVNVLEDQIKGNED